MTRHAMLRLLRQVSWPQLRQSWGRTALVVGGVAIGVSLIVAMNVINTSVLVNFRNVIALLAGPADLQVTLGFGEVGFLEDTVDGLRADPDVAAAVPMVRGTVAFADAPAETLDLFGVDLMAEEDLDRYHVTMLTSRREASLALLEPNSLFVTTRLAEERGLAVGDTLRLSVLRGVQAFTIRGLLSTEGLAAALGGRLVLMDLPAAQIHLGKEHRVDQIDLVLRDGANTQAVARRLADTLPPTLSIATPRERAASYPKILESFQAMLTGLSALALIAGVFIIYNTSATAAARRALVMVELRLIGAESTALFRLLMLEAALLGMCGALLGLAIGVAQGRLLSASVVDSMGIIFQLRFAIETLSIDPAQLALIALVGVTAAAAASYFPARRLADAEPLAMTRGDRATLPGGLPTSRLFGLWLVLVAASAAALIAEERSKSIAWGNVGSTLWNSSIVVIAVPLVRVLASLLTRILPRAFGPEGRVAAESLTRSPVRSGVTIAAIALVLAVGITVAALVRSSRISIGSYVEGFLSGDLVVSAIATEGGWLETPISRDVVETIRPLPGIARIETGRVVPGQAFRGQRVGVLALSAGMLATTRYPAGWFIEGDPPAATRALQRHEGVAVSTGFSDRFDVHAGDRITLATPTGSLRMPVVGVVPDYVSDRGSVIMSSELYARRWLDTTVNRINVYLQPNASAEKVRADILARLGTQHRLKVLPIAEVRRYQEDYVDRAFALTDAIQLLIVIVTIAGILDLLLSAIVERRRELALWRLLGADERVVRRSVVIESATIGALGAMLGIAVGAVTAWIWVGINFRYLLGYYLDFHFPIAATIWYVALVILLAMLAGYGAARRATEQSIIAGVGIE